MQYKIATNILVTCLVLFFTSCENKFERVVYSTSQPKITNLEVSVEGLLTVPDSVFITATVVDKNTPLSTLDITLKTASQELFQKSIRTKGYEAEIKNFAFYIPFQPNLNDNEPAILTIQAINIEGTTHKEVRELKLQRPKLSKQLYLHIENEVYTLEQSTTNPYEYISAEDNYPQTFKGKISTHESLEESNLIWGEGEDTNTTSVINNSQGNFNFNFEEWQIQNITFNTLSFELGIIGTQQYIAINGTQLEAKQGLFEAGIKFEQGKEFTIEGIENIKEAYNRDFFEYNEATGKFKFLRESGTWEVYYSSKYNYIWVINSDHVAPQAFWIIGHGFTCSPVWNDDYFLGGWDSEDITRMAYVVKIAPKKYQTTMYITNQHEWDSFEFEIYSNKESGKEKGILLKEGSITSDTEGFTISNSNGLTNADNFTPGYYQLTFDTTLGVGNETVHIKRILNNL
ncbi:hypothetical protein Bcop_1830 [Bacteroides coprosuis DSM 18011]|uniref:Uncharacterized protein n=1 Tax=Bacteroides coprosuis DSM 18011 TaxID=679937 RepID=F3ZRS9_9BACE|nr:DUF5125 domain-containing protein [Bacteroides coprosuis]EGJ72018.1 hypothetical protein Bcop_1830 [Bacteroides coprosuis DSM 18011]